MFSRLHQLITNAWEVGSVPQPWNNANIGTIYKKGDRTDYGTYRGIFSSFHSIKIFARILLNRLSTHITPEVDMETQCCFRGNRSTVDMTFCRYKISALSRTDHCTWYLSTSVRRSIKLGGPGYGSY